MPNSTIIGTGHYLPEKVVTNHDLEKVCDTSHDWIVERSGITQRHWCEDGQGNIDLAEQAARQAIAAAGIETNDIDIIVVATCTGDYAAPAIAVMLQSRLGLSPRTAFDVNAACAGFVYALSVADQFLKAGTAKRALVVGSERISTYVDYEDRGTAVLFGDGAGAVVLEASEEQGVLKSHLYGDGDAKDILFLGNGNPVFEPLEMANKIHMNGREVFRYAVNAFNEAIAATLESTGVTKEDIDWFVPHQANIRIINAVAKKFDFPIEKTIVTVDKTANTSAASVPIAFDIGVRDGRIKKGDLVLIAAFGAGLTWGASVFRY